MEPTLFNRVFRYGSLLRQEKEAIEQKEQRIYSNLYSLINCEKIADFIILHRKLASEGGKVDITLNDQYDNYKEVDVNNAGPEHYWCGTYDHDSTFHGTEMLEFEQNPTTEDYFYYSYARAWNTYFTAIYKAITGKLCQDVHYPVWFQKLKETC